MKNIDWWKIGIIGGAMGCYIIAGVITGVAVSSKRVAPYEKWGEVVGIMYTKECSKCGYDQVEGYVSLVTMDNDGRIGDEYCPNCHESKVVIEEK